MNKENNKLLSEKFDELKEGHATQKEINKEMTELCHELEWGEQSQLQAEEEARFETYLQSLPEDPNEN